MACRAHDRNRLRHAEVREAPQGGGFTQQQAEALATAEAELLEDNLATTRHPKELEATVQRDIKELETVFRRDIKELEAALRRYIKELDTKIERIQAVLKRDIEELRADLKRDIKELETRVFREMKDLEYRMTIGGRRRRHGHIGETPMTSNNCKPSGRPASVWPRS